MADDNFNSNSVESGRARSREPGVNSISIDTQSFVNLGQLMGSRGHGVVTAAGATPAGEEGVGSSINQGNLGASSSFLSGVASDNSDADDLGEFDQLIFNPTGSSVVSAWSGHDLCSDDGGGEAEETNDVDDDDGENDSVLPALPRSPSPGSPVGSDAAGAIGRSASNRRPFNDDRDLGWAEDFQREAAAPEAPVASESGNGDGGCSGGIYSGECPDVSRLDVVSSEKFHVLVENETIDTTLPAAVISNDVVTAKIPPIDHADCHQQESCSNKLDEGEEEYSQGDEQPVSTAMTITEMVGIPEAAGAEAAGSKAMTIPAGDQPGSSGSLLREPWLHVPMGAGETDALVADFAGSAAAEQEQLFENQQEQNREPHGMHALTGCQQCIMCGVEKVAAFARPRLEQLAQVAKARAEASVEACSEGKEAVIKAVDNIPQAPVRMWLRRIAGSLVLGAILGGAGTYYAFPRIITASVSSSEPSSDARFSSSSAPSSWNAFKGQQQHQHQRHESSGSAEQIFADRLNNALFAARAGEAAAQQGLLEEVRNILAATGKSGGISAEQILRQFNAKRFAEASKAYSAAEGIMGADPLFFSSANRASSYSSSSSSSSSSSGTQHQQHRHAASGANAECTGSGTDGAFCNTDSAGASRQEGGDSGSGSYRGFPPPPRTSGGSSGSGSDGNNARPHYRRPCGGGGWVC